MAAIDIWHGAASWQALRIVALIALIADALTFFQCYFKPLRRSHRLSQQLSAAGITAPVPTASELFNPGPLILQRTAAADAFQLQRLLARLPATEGVKAFSAKDGGVRLTGSHDRTARALAAFPSNFETARLTIVPEPEGKLRLIYRAEFGQVRRVVIGVCFFAATAVGLGVFAWASPYYRGYLRVLLVALAGYAVAILIAYWPGQRLLTQQFMDTLILESSSRS